MTDTPAIDPNRTDRVRVKLKTLCDWVGVITVARVESDVLTLIGPGGHAIAMFPAGEWLAVLYT